MAISASDVSVSTSGNIRWTGGATPNYTVINETKARLILEFPNNRNLLFYGKVDSNGKCEVAIPALKEMNECEGNVLLEVIADSTHFESWRDKFKLEPNKRVRVEMVESEKEVIVENTVPKPRVEITTKDDADDVNFLDFNEYINENKINLNSIIKNKTNFFNLLYEYKKDKNLTKEDIIKIVEGLQKKVKSNQIENLLHS